MNRPFTVPADGWYHLVALGEFPNWRLTPDPANPAEPRRERVMQICDAACAASIVNRFQALASVPQFPGLLVDWDHSSSVPEKTTEAAGWVTEMQNRPDGVWARIRWTDVGESAIQGGRFRYLSPTFRVEQCEVLGNNRLRPTAIDTVGLTNRPGIRTLQPLTNREPCSSDPADPGNTSPAGSGRKESIMDYKKELLAMLGLAEDATDEQISAACASRKEDMAAVENRATSAEALANNTRTALDAAQARILVFENADRDRLVEADLTEFAAVIENRDAAREALLANRDSARKVFGAVKKPAAAAATLPSEPLRNRSTAAQPVLTPAADEGQTLRNRLDAQDHFIKEVQNELRLDTRAAAVEIAMQRKPELFG